MDFKGKVKNICRNWMSNLWEITFETDENITGCLNDIREKELSVIAKQYRQKRSLDANAYYWLLLSKLADAVRISKTRAHNIMLRRYGQPEVVDGQSIYVIVPDTLDGENRALEADTYHLKPTSEVKIGVDGTMFRTYRMLRGSSTYDTKEMSILIDGLVSECKEIGIETLTPDEIKRMMEAYEKHYSGR